MVPLVMSTPRDENPGSAYEEFATHLSLYDDSFSITEGRTVPVFTEVKGPVPPSVLCPASRTNVDITGQVKVKRKCGRPRNPIPRHKRESHINAEHRRRGKIQDGFRTLKNIVPKYEQASGRDSKADILFKAVDYSKLLQNDIKELSSTLEALRAERDLLTLDIKNYESLVPDLCTYTEMTVNMDECYEEYVQQKNKESWTFGTFKAVMHPLFESYKLSVHGESMGEFLCSVADWASSSLSFSNLHSVCSTALRNMCKQELDTPGSFKDELMQDISNFRSAGCVGHSLTSDSNNNNFRSTGCVGHSLTSDSNNNNCSSSNNPLNNQTFTSEHFDCQDVGDCGCSHGGVGTSNLEVYVNTFDNSHTTSSPSNKCGAHIHPRQDLVPFSGTNVCSNNTNNIFSDFYYNLDHNIHHLNLARAGVDGSDHWPPLYFRQQHWHPYQNNFSPPSYFHNVKRPHPIWGSQHPSLSRPMTGDITSLSSQYYERGHPFSDRSDLPTPKEPSDTLSSSAPYLAQTTNYTDHGEGRQKRPSQSSSESDGSLLNMEAFAKQSTETIAECDKYGQVSPSTDSGISPGSNLFVPSPGTLCNRNSDYAYPYPSNSSVDHLKLHKHHDLPHDRTDSVNNPSTMSLPSYRDTFGSRTTEQCRQQGTRLDEIRPLWGTNTVGPNSRQTFSERLETSTLLGQMLSQNNSTPSTVQTNMTPSPPCFKTSNNSSHIFPVTTSTIFNHFTNEFSLPGKQENGCRLSLSQPDEENIHAPARDLPSTFLKDNQQDEHLHVRANVSQSNCFSFDAKNPSFYNSSWLQHYHKQHDLSNFDAHRTTEFDEFNEARKQICYFEMAHQQLLKHHSLSRNKISELKSPDLAKSPRLAHLHTLSHETDALNSRPDPAGNSQIPSPHRVNHTNLFIGQPNRHRIPAKACEVSVDATLKHKVRQKSSNEVEDSETQLLHSVSGCKKQCNWQQLDKSRQAVPVRGRCNISEVTRETIQRTSVATTEEPILPF